CLVLAALVPSRWAVLLVIPAIVFPLFFLGDLYWWLRDSGLGLDPKAPLSSSIKPFVPRVLGAGKIAQFRTEASLAMGSYLSLSAGGASLLFAWTRLRFRRPLGPAGAGPVHRKGALAIGAIVAVALAARPLRANTLVVELSGSITTLSDALLR